MYNGIFAMICKIIYQLQDELHMSIEKKKKKKLSCAQVNHLKAFKKTIGIAIFSFLYDLNLFSHFKKPIFTTKKKKRKEKKNEAN